MTLSLALDAMGGDSAPQIVIDGANLAWQRNCQLSFRIFGPEKLISDILRNYPKLAQQCQIFDAQDIITGDMRPSSALRNGRNSSMGKAVKDVAENNSGAVVSAGNTGAYMAMAKFFFNTFKKIDRPAIPGFIPNINSQTLVLDLGANLECSAQNLAQFAVMGQTYVRQLMGIEKPVVGLLNVGSEELKGSATLQEAAAIIKGLPNMNFYGFVEGNHITEGITDVVVTDGFSGNILLKAIEGTAKLINNFLKNSLQSCWRGKLGYLMAEPVFANMKKRFDPRLYNGAMFLGLQKIAVKSHGGTDAVGFANAIEVAAAMVERNVIQDLESSLVEVV